MIGYFYRLVFKTMLVWEFVGRVALGLARQLGRM